MNGLDSTVAVTIIVTTLTILLFIGLVVLLLVLNHNRRNRHRAEMAEVRVQHAEEVRKVEQEVLAHTLTEVGRDLHDNIGQLLTVTRMGVNDLLNTCDDKERAAEVKGTLDSTIAEVRRLSRTLNVDRWEVLSLAQMIANACDRVQNAGGLQVEFHTKGHEPLITADQKLVLFRIFQELMNNALKHAKASRIEVLLADGEGPRLRVRDNGTGFDPSVATGPSENSGQGLANIRRRAALIGYHCEVVTSPGGGTTVTIASA